MFWRLPLWFFGVIPFFPQLVASKWFSLSFLMTCDLVRMRTEISLRVENPLSYTDWSSENTQPSDILKLILTPLINLHYMDHFLWLDKLPGTLESNLKHYFSTLLSVSSNKLIHLVQSNKITLHYNKFKVHISTKHTSNYY